MAREGAVFVERSAGAGRGTRCCTILRRVALDDTHPRVQAVITRMFRDMTPAQRFAMAAEMTDFVCEQSLAAIAATMPGATHDEVHLRWCEVHYGKELTDRLRAFLVARSS